MNHCLIYVHGKGGSAGEVLHYARLFPDFDIVGFDYKAKDPGEAREEFPAYFDGIAEKYEKVVLVANSIGAFFAMNALGEKKIDRAYFISPIVDMEKLIANMMLWAGVTEAELREKKEISTNFGETLSWDYLSDVRAHPIHWPIPTKILYGEKDELTALGTMTAFAEKINAPLTIMPNGEHWFHTEEQMAFLDAWIKEG